MQLSSLEEKQHSAGAHIPTHSSVTVVRFSVDEHISKRFDGARGKAADGSVKSNISHGAYEIHCMACLI